MNLRPVSLAVMSAIAIGAFGVPTFASAQAAYDAPPPPPPSAPYGYVDPCRQARTNHVAGSIIGAIAGAVIGSNIAGHGAKSEGGAIGGVAGALVGSKVAKGSAASVACYGSGPAYGPGPAPRPAYYDRGPYAQQGYVDRGSSYGYDRPEPAYGNNRPEPTYGYDDQSDDRDDAEYGYRKVGDGSSADGCKLAESPIYMPDGRTEKRYVRVCADAGGRYHVVD
jgi:hypothetical protein